MSAPYRIILSWPSFYQKLSKLVEIWQSYAETILTDSVLRWFSCLPTILSPTPYRYTTKTRFMWSQCTLKASVLSMGQGHCSTARWQQTAYDRATFDRDKSSHRLKQVHWRSAHMVPRHHHGNAPANARQQSAFQQSSMQYYSSYKCI